MLIADTFKLAVPVFSIVNVLAMELPGNALPKSVWSLPSGVLSPSLMVKLLPFTFI